MSNLGVYIQIPFCQTKCTYCNFHTGVVSSGRFSPYAEAVGAEIRGHRELYRAAGVELPEGFEKAVVDTVYIGGGTPSLLEPGLLQGIMDAIRDTFAGAGGSVGAGAGQRTMEVTLEADPETVEAGKAAAWVRAGINRVSFGVQSFSDKELVAAGRMHRRSDIHRAA